MATTVEAQATQKIKNQILKWKKRDLNNAVFNNFKAKNRWLKKQFDADYNQFYDYQLNKEVHSIKLSKEFRNELYLYYWVEANGYDRFSRNYAKVQDYLFQLRSPFYHRLNYYRYLVNKKGVDVQLVFYDLIATWESLLVKRIFDYRLALINEKRLQHLQAMYDNITILENASKLMQTVFNFFGPFWRYNVSEIKHFNFRTLEIFAYYLEEDPAILEIASLLGRFAKISNLIEERVYNTIQLEYRWQKTGLWPEEIAGITQSNDLQNMIINEIMYFQHPLLRLFWYKKYIESQLLTLQFVSNERTPFETIKPKLVQIPVPLEKGPFIVCIDTSNSMQGIAEMIAKAITLAIVKIALRENRPCYLINFSNVYDIYDLNNKKDALPQMLKFLSKRFTSSTNIQPALNHALNVLDYNEYFNADVLVISDFAAARPLKASLEKIAELKARRNRFNAICIGNIYNKAFKPLFNNFWLYNPEDPFTGEQIVTSLENQFLAEYENINIEKIVQDFN